MKIRLDHIGDEPHTWQQEASVDAADLERDEVAAVGPIRWRGTVARVHPGFLLRAKASYEQTLVCFRCLAETESSVNTGLETLVLTEAPRSTVREQELGEGDLGVLVVDDETLDLAPLLLEQIQLNVPMKPLCREDCAGLCPYCGQDRNEKPCHCADEQVDPRWSALAALRDRLEP